MLDSYHISPPSTHVSVHNETKPHDPADAARLYGELERLAREKVVSATTFAFGAQNELKALVIHLDKDYLHCQDRARVLFELNSVQYDFIINWDAYALKKELATIIGERIVSELLKKFK